MTFKKIIHLYGIQMKNLYGDKLGRAAKQFEIQQVVQKESHEAVETIRCIVRSFIATSTYFLLKHHWKRKLEKCFLGARVWAPKLVYRSPKRPEYTGFYLTIRDSYFTILVEVFKNYILAENINFTNHIDWPEQTRLGSLNL